MTLARSRGPESGECHALAVILHGDAVGRGGGFGQNVGMSLAGLLRRVGGHRWLAVVGRRLVPLDRLLGRLTRGRFVALGLRELPSLLLTTVGRRTGQPRTTPLLYVRDGDGFVVIGSNWGQRHHPAWSANLLATPDATVTIDGSEIPVRARLATGAERDRLRGMLLAIWPAYTVYETRSGGRNLRIFRLERAGDARPARVWPDRGLEAPGVDDRE